MAAALAALHGAQRQPAPADSLPLPRSQEPPPPSPPQLLLSKQTGPSTTTQRTVGTSKAAAAACGPADADPAPSAGWSSAISSGVHSDVSDSILSGIAGAQLLSRTPLPMRTRATGGPSLLQCKRKLGRPLIYAGDSDHPSLTNAEHHRIRRCARNRF